MMIADCPLLAQSASKLTEAGGITRGCIQVIVRVGEDRVEEDADSWRLL